MTSPRAPREFFAARYGYDEDGEIKGNFMTPTVMGYFDAGKFVVELSRGLGFARPNQDRPDIFGITVLRRSDGEPMDGFSGRTKLSALFGSEADAYEYIDEIGELDEDGHEIGEPEEQSPNGAGCWDV